MNKINIKNNKLTEEISTNITILPKEEAYQIQVHENTVLEVEIENQSKLSLDVIIEPFVQCQIQLKNIGLKTELSMNYTVQENGHLDIVNYMDIEAIQYQSKIHLQGINAEVVSILKTACTGLETYDVTIYHEAKNTKSNIIQHGMNVDKGSLHFDISTYIPKGMKNTYANQDSRIVNLTNQECTIRPNLYIDEYDVIANHSAHIGSFTDEEIFYIQRLGIPYSKVCNLLLQGFMKSLVEEEIVTKLFAKYWR